MKLIGLIARTVGALAVLKFTGCVEHTVIHARTVNVTKPINVDLRVEMDGLPIPLK